MVTVELNYYKGLKAKEHEVPLETPCQCRICARLRHATDTPKTVLDTPHGVPINHVGHAT